MSFQNLFTRRKILSKAFISRVACCIVINNFFMSFEISHGSNNSSQNTLRLIKEFEKIIPSFMESLIANSILDNFPALLPNFDFCKGDWVLDYVCTQFRDFTKTFSFSKSFSIREVTRTFSLC